MTIGAAGENTSFDNYTGNGTTTFFPFSFAIVGPFEVLVIAGGQLKFENTDYYLRPTGITFYEPPPLGQAIYVGRATDLNQLVNWIPFDSFDAASTEYAVDKLIVLKQEAAEWRGRMNLATVLSDDQVTIVNTKGNDANIALWIGGGADDEEISESTLAGAFSAVLAENTLPPRNTSDDVENRVWMAFSAPGDVPAGGLAGEHLAKASDIDYDLEWVPADEGGIPEAPNDGQDYVRKSLAWAVADYFSGAWADITGKPSTFPPSPHTHVLADITDAGTMAAVDDAPSDGEDYVRKDAAWAIASYFSGVYGDLTGIPTEFPPSAHTHVLADVTDSGSMAAIDDAPNDGQDYVRNSLAWEIASYFSGVYGDLTGIPTEFPPAAHTHVLADVTDSGTMAAIDDAPSDGTQYARQDGAWATVTGGGSGSTVYVQAQEPTSPLAGDFWLETPS